MENHDIKCLYQCLTAVAVVAKQQLIIIFRGSTDCASLALDALPWILADAHDHVLSELKTNGMSRSSAYMARDQLLGLEGLLVLVLVAEAEVAVLRGGGPLDPVDYDLTTCK